MSAKAQLRQRMLAQRASLSGVEIARQSAMIAVFVGSVPAFCHSHTVMLYLALPQEVQTLALLTQACQRQQRIAVPVVNGTTLAAVALDDASMPLRRGRFGILEPAKPWSVIAPEEIGCIIVPGLAFDVHGGRLGFGKGYYDRFLAQCPTTTYRCGVAFHMHVVTRVPQDAHDICMHGIVTEQGYRPCIPALPTA